MPAARPTPSVIRVDPLPGRPTHGRLRVGPLSVPCRLGRSGTTRLKREGDGATPVARMRLLEVLWRADRILPPTTRLPIRPIRADDGWADDAGDGRYNRPVRLPFRPSHERLAREDGLYDIVVVLDWNIRRRSLGRGSAIFFHLTGPASGATAGCVAVAPEAMRRVLAALDRDAVMVVGGSPDRPAKREPRRGGCRAR